MVPIIEMGISQHGKSPKPGGSIEKMVYFWMTLGYYRRWNPQKTWKTHKTTAPFMGGKTTWVVGFKSECKDPCLGQTWRLYSKL